MPDGTHISENQGDVIGVGVGGTGNITGKNITVQGNIIHLTVTPETLAALRQVAAVPTEVSPTGAAGMQGGALPAAARETQGAIDQLLGLLSTAPGRGQELRSIQGGEVNLQQIDLLIKKAVLVSADAREWLMKEATGKPDPNDLNDPMLKGYLAKLDEGYKLLQEANRLEPTNTEVLLHMAELLMELTPDDASDEQRILSRVQMLLREPRDDTERFRLAQAIFLMAHTQEPVNRDGLTEARELFAQLGKSIWVKQIDEQLGQFQPWQPAPAPPVQAFPPMGAPPNRPFSPPPVPFPPQFQPARRWMVQIGDAVGSTMQLDLQPNGIFQAMQQAGYMSVQAGGQWAYVPQNRGLHLQGVINGMQPFMLSIAIQAPQGNGWYGVGADGYGYQFTPLN